MTPTTVRARRRRSKFRALAAFCSVLLLAVAMSQSGCGMRLSRHSIVNRRAIQVDLVTEKEGLFGTKPQDFEHPAIISTPRLINILNAIEVETPAEGGGVIREPAIALELVELAAVAIAEGFAKAGPNERLGVKLIRKEASLGIFHRKYLTSFLAMIQDGHLYIDLARVNWPIPQAKETGKLPEPRPDERPMKFRVVSGEHLFYAGPQTLEIAWQNPVFRSPYHLPGTSGGEQKRREVLLQSPVPKEELRSAEEAGTPLEDLSPEQLRALADLEEDRAQGRITESEYQRAKRQLLRNR